MRGPRCALLLFFLFVVCCFFPFSFGMRMVVVSFFSLVPGTLGAGGMVWVFTQHAATKHKLLLKLEIQTHRLYNVIFAFTSGWRGTACVVAEVAAPGDTTDVSYQHSSSSHSNHTAAVGIHLRQHKHRPSTHAHITHRKTAHKTQDTHPNSHKPLSKSGAGFPGVYECAAGGGGNERTLPIHNNSHRKRTEKRTVSRHARPERVSLPPSASAPTNAEGGEGEGEESPGRHPRQHGMQTIVLPTQSIAVQSGEGERHRNRNPQQMSDAIDNTSLHHRIIQYAETQQKAIQTDKE